MKDQKLVIESLYNGVLSLNGHGVPSISLDKGGKHTFDSTKDYIKYQEAVSTLINSKKLVLHTEEGKTMQPMNEVMPKAEVKPIINEVVEEETIGTLNEETEELKKEEVVEEEVKINKNKRSR